MNVYTSIYIYVHVYAYHMHCPSHILCTCACTRRQYHGNVTPLIYILARSTATCTRARTRCLHVIRTHNCSIVTLPISHTRYLHTYASPLPRLLLNYYLHYINIYMYRLRCVHVQMIHVHQRNC